MDIPRPFNKYPAGYRPVSGNGNAMRTMSTLSLFPSRAETDVFANEWRGARGSDPFFNDRGMSLSQVTLADINSNYPTPPGPFTRQNADLNKDINHASLPTSPAYNESLEDIAGHDYQRNRQTSVDRRASEPLKSMRGGEALLADLRQSDEFIRKLRRQREKIENYGRQRDWEHDSAAVCGAVQPVERVNDTRVAWRAGANQNRRAAHSNSVPASLLHKTRSDSSIFHDVGPGPPPGQYESMNPLGYQRDSPRHFEAADQDRIAPPAERRVPIERAPLEGFFASKQRRDPNWTTSPPPPFGVPEDTRIPKPVYYQAKQYRKRIASGNDPHMPSMHQEDNAMAFRESHLAPKVPQSSYGVSVEESNKLDMMDQRHFNVRSQANTHSFPNPVQYRAFSPVEAPRQEFAPLRPSSQENYPLAASYHRQNNYPRQPCFYDNDGSAIYNSSGGAVESDRGHRRSQPPFHGGAVFTEFNENVPVDMDDMKTSQVYRNVPSSNGNMPNYSAKASRQVPVRSKERSFAILSRPLTPPAVLQNVSDVADPPFSSQFRRYGSFNAGDRLPRWSRSTASSAATATSTDDLEPSNRNLGSPMSSYDNESDIELRHQPSACFSFPNPSQHIASTPAHGILLRNQDGVSRPLKKVVFVCDSLGADQYLNESVASSEPPPHVKAFDSALSDAIQQWSDLSDQLGGDVKAMREKVTAVFNSLRLFLWTAASQPEPSADDVQKLVSPLVNLLSEINSFKDARRKAPQFNHLCAVAEGIPAVGWVLVKKTPAPYVKEMLEASMFYINRILKEFKEGDQKNIEWARQWKGLLETLQTFVRQTHTTGLVWNSAPGCYPPASEETSASSASAGRGAPSGGPPPPPPPPPPSLLADIAPAAPADGSKLNRDALFAELNKGEAVTAGLRKVTADMQTHKNPALREHAPVPATLHPKSQQPKPKQPSAPAAVRHDPVIELKDGKQWNVEYVVGNRNVVINVKDKKQTVYIYKCEDSVIVIKGKLNSITLDSCRKTSVVFDALVSQCETINCQRVEIQTLGEMPTLSIQKTDGCQVYLSEAAKNAEIVTSKSSEMNLLVPKEDGDFMEFPVPEQFKTTYVDGKLVTCVSDIA